MTKDTGAYTCKSVNVFDAKINYIESGSGDPILFLHGIPASSYLWRNVIPHLSSLGHCIAPDLIGCGKSDKPDISYTISEHIRYIEAFIDALKLKNLTIIMHGWGSVIGCHYAASHPNNCKGLVFYESFLHAPSNEVNLAYEEQLAALQQQLGSGMNIANTAMVDALLKQLTMRKLTEAEIDPYRQPFLTDSAIKPVAQYIRELPKEHGNTEVNKLIANYTDALTRSTTPKLMLYSIPGFITPMATVMWAKENLPNIEVAEIGEELHFGQETHADLMGETISIWLQGTEQA